MNKGNGTALIALEAVTAALEPSTGLTSTKLAKAAIDHLSAWSVENRIKAIHEAGHAGLACLVRIGVKEIDIKGSAQGHTTTDLGDDDQSAFVTASRSRDTMVMSLGGYHAETVLLGEPSVGSSTDIERVCAMALSYCTSWMGGAITLPSSPWGYGSTPTSVIDAQAVEVARLVRDASDRARGLVEEHKTQIMELAKAIYGERRLTDGPLDAALRAAGFEPARLSESA